MINRVVLIGRLTKDLELRYTQSGVAVARFNLAVNRQFKDKQTGQREADFISCQIWRQEAENLVNYTHKGSLIGVEGRITTSNYENKEGQRVYRTDVTVENFSLLEPRQNGNKFNYQDNQANNYQSNQGYNPAQGQSAETNTGHAHPYRFKEA